MRKIIATRCDICTYVFVRTYKIRTMVTIVSINIRSIPDAYSARTIYVSKHVPWKAPFSLRLAYSPCVFALRLRLASSPCVFALGLRLAYSQCVFALPIRLASSSSPCIFVFALPIRLASSLCILALRLRFAFSP